MEQGDQNATLHEILATLRSLQHGHSKLSSAINALSARLDRVAVHDEPKTPITESKDAVLHLPTSIPTTPTHPPKPSSSNDDVSEKDSKRRQSTTSRIILTTYPGQSGIDPVPMDWGNKDPLQRGPVVVSRHQNTVRRRNAIGAHGGSYAIYHALAVASKHLDVEHRPDFTNTQPAANIGPHPQWADKKKIVSMDPLGHLAPWIFKDMITNYNLDIRPTIAITKAHMKLPELEQSVRSGRLVPDGKICVNEMGELAVTKVAVEPVWYLPGVAERFGIDEGTLRRALFEVTGGSYPELITRGDIKLFLPPIGGLTVYCFGDPAKMSDPNVRLALRVHDECNGSDVFGSDICTCRPYLIFGVEEAVKEAQNGGSGVVIYFRKEGRALGEVTKYLVYNARKRGSDRASEYFKRTENIAGVKDMRFQALMPDVLHWLGITKIDRMLSMSNMKHDAIVEQGIPIHERVPIPDELIPEDSRVEIDAKIHSGYCMSHHLSFLNPQS
ncbi:Putative GTP cyclohydrolase [Emydomyces testavorans]|uniref:GTP cyclohydrolase n=1 Tax=Emydomyces testavorans TaxID=2070801 RepID=A0AAF0IFT7_9EURO|nr:Putative GTP cyclohydrolase [Emydomyces testavorans]